MSLENKPAGPVAKAQEFAPAKMKKDDPHAMKYGDHAKLEEVLALNSVKTMGHKQLLAQLASPKTSEVFKLVCENELEERAQAREAIQNKN